MTMKKYTHIISLNFELQSDNEFPTAEEMIEALTKKVASVNPENAKDELELFDTEEND